MAVVYIDYFFISIRIHNGTADCGGWTAIIRNSTLLTETQINSLWLDGTKVFSYYIDNVLYGIYKRVTSYNGNFYQQILIHWLSNGNILNTDFYLFSSFTDLHNLANKWQYCNYDDASVGIFRDCGKSNLVGGNWVGNGSIYTLGLVPYGRSASVYLK